MLIIAVLSRSCSMNMFTIMIELGSIFLFSTFFLFFLRKIAKKIGLVDQPNFRKKHQGSIPLVGGISVFAGICFSFFISNLYIPNLKLYLLCSGILVLVGILDDKFDISVKIRVIVQAVISISMMCIGKISLSSLGFIFGEKEIVLGPFSFFFTIFAVWTVINAFNMIDGIDGLLSSISIVSLVSISIITWIAGRHNLSIWCLVIIISMLPYTILNLGILGKRYKMFMGDAGSTLIGFTIIWMILEISQGKSRLISPVTALWIISIPILDMISVIHNRIRKKNHLFSPDRQHIHHLMIRSGITTGNTCTIITLIDIFLASIGIIIHYLHCLPEWAMLVLFLLYCFLYNYCLKNIWKIVNFFNLKFIK